MKRSRAALMVVPLLIGISLMLAACVRSFDSGTPVLGFGQPYGSIDLVDWQ
jgi:hypothetical protein